MFSLIAAGKMFKRSSDSYNILAVSAFFQLLINPYDITQVGFQLSYLAVLGIFAFYQPINDLISPDRKMLSWIWSILAVSIAAQLATFPLASYYFCMFPVYFLATNLVVVPLAAVITYFAVTILAVGAAGFTPEWLAWPLKWSLRFMQGSVETIQSWPGAVIKPIVLSPAQVILIYIAIISIFAFGVLGYRKWAFVLLLSILLVSVISAVELYKKLDKSEVIVYQVPGNSAIDLLNNRKALFISDSALISNPGKIGFQIEPNRMREGIKEIQVIRSEEHNFLSSASLWIDWPFIFFRGKTLIIIDQHWKNFIPAEKISCDLAILSGNPQVSPENLKLQVAADNILIDSSLPFYKAEQLLKSFQDNDIPCHSVRHEGAFVMKW
jgi:competence protein ComEC